MRMRTKNLDLRMTSYIRLYKYHDINNIYDVMGGNLSHTLKSMDAEPANLERAKVKESQTPPSRRHRLPATELSSDQWRSDVINSIMGET